MPAKQGSVQHPCPGTAADRRALATHFGLDTASEAFSAALCVHAVKSKAALTGRPEGPSRTSTRRIATVQSQSAHIESR